MTEKQTAITCEAELFHARLFGLGNDAPRYVYSNALQGARAIGTSMRPDPELLEGCVVDDLEVIAFEDNSALTIMHSSKMFRGHEITQIGVDKKFVKAIKDSAPVPPLQKTLWVYLIQGAIIETLWATGCEEEARKLSRELVDEAMKVIKLLESAGAQKDIDTSGE